MIYDHENEKFLSNNELKPFYKEIVKKYREKGNKLRKEMEVVKHRFEKEQHFLMGKLDAFQTIEMEFEMKLIQLEKENKKC